MPLPPENQPPVPPTLRDVVVSVVVAEVLARQRLVEAEARRRARIAHVNAQTSRYLAKIAADFRRDVAAAEKLRARFPRVLGNVKQLPAA